MATHALTRHLVLVGFMGAGKTTIGAEFCASLGSSSSTWTADIESNEGKSIAELWRDRGEDWFREQEAVWLALSLDARRDSVIALAAARSRPRSSASTSKARSSS